MVWGLAWSFPPGNTLLPGKSTAKVAKSVQIAGKAWEMPAAASDIAAMMLVFIFMFLIGLVIWVGSWDELQAMHLGVVPEQTGCERFATGVIKLQKMPANKIVRVTNYQYCAYFLKN